MAKYCTHCGKEIYDPTLERKETKDNNAFTLAIACAIYSLLVCAVAFYISGSGIFDGKIVTVLGKSFYQVDAGVMENVDFLVTTIAVMSLFAVIAFLCAALLTYRPKGRE